MKRATRVSKPCSCALFVLLCSCNNRHVHRMIVLCLGDGWRAPTWAPKPDGSARVLWTQHLRHSHARLDDRPRKRLTRNRWHRDFRRQADVPRLRVGLAVRAALRFLSSRLWPSGAFSTTGATPRCAGLARLWRRVPRSVHLCLWPGASTATRPPMRGARGRSAGPACSGRARGHSGSGPRRGADTALAAVGQLPTQPFGRGRRGGRQAINAHPPA